MHSPNENDIMKMVINEQDPDVEYNLSLVGASPVITRRKKGEKPPLDQVLDAGQEQYRPLIFADMAKK